MGSRGKEERERESERVSLWAELKEMVELSRVHQCLSAKRRSRIGANNESSCIGQACGQRKTLLC